MEFVHEKIYVPNKHSFITRKLEMDPNSDKIHSHNNFELNLITSGFGRRIVGNNISSYAPGDLVLLGPNISHCWEVLELEKHKKPECIVTHFYENIINSDFFNIPELEDVAELLKQANRGIHFGGPKTKKVATSLKQIVNFSGLKKYIELLKVFQYLLETEEKEYLSFPSIGTDQFESERNRIEKVYEYVFQNIQSGITLSEAAKLVYLEPASFCRFFKKRTHQTFMEYVKNVRIGIATRLLAETEKPITQIAFECGYNNLANFNHYFKQTMKQTPSEYRKTFK